MFKRLGRCHLKSSRAPPGRDSTSNKTHLPTKCTAWLFSTISSKISNAHDNQANKNIETHEIDNSCKIENCGEVVHTSNSQHVNDTSWNVSGKPYCPEPEHIKVPFVHFTKVRNQFLAIRSLPLSPSVKDQLKSHSFNNWLYTDAELINFVKFMFLDLNLPELCHFSIDVLENWLFAVYSRYNNVPFHNFKHAFMVTQMMYCIIKTINLQLYLSPVDLLILLFSAVSHDLDHPGFTNSYQVNAGSWLALRYNDISPLENHHCVTAFEIISNPTTNITSGLTQTESRHFRRSVIRCILSTDMAIHTECISQFQYLRQQVIAVSHKLTSPSMENNATTNTPSVNHVATTADDDDEDVDDGSTEPCRPNQCYSVFPSPQLASFTPLPPAHVSPPSCQPPRPTSVTVTQLLSNSRGLTSHDHNEVDHCDNDNDDDDDDKESRQRRQQQDDSLIRSSLFSLIHEQPEYLLRFLMILLKVCDVSNETRSPSVADAWSDCLFNEFFMQANAEKQAGLPVAAFMDPDCVVKSTSQLNFLDSILIPLIKELVYIFSELNILLEAVLGRVKYFSQMRQRELAEQETNNCLQTDMKTKMTTTTVISNSLSCNQKSASIRANSVTNHLCNAQSFQLSNKVVLETNKSMPHQQHKQQHESSAVMRTEHAYPLSNTSCFKSPPPPPSSSSSSASPIKCQQPQTPLYVSVQSSNNLKNITIINESSLPPPPPPPTSSSSLSSGQYNEDQRKSRDFIQ
ncbi:unnamed protein product [Trichobilharzia szidati]|nr:unnamed protein product [Trichobilharzia szidati]